MQCLTAGLRQQQPAVSAAELGRISRGLRWIRSGLRVSGSMSRPQTRLHCLPNKATCELTGWLIGHPVFTLEPPSPASPPLLRGTAAPAPCLQSPRHPWDTGAAQQGKPGHYSQLRGTRFGFTTGSVKLQGVQVEFPPKHTVGPLDWKNNQVSHCMNCWKVGQRRRYKQPPSQLQGSRQVLVKHQNQGN